MNQQNRVLVVLSRIEDDVRRDSDLASDYADFLEDMLNKMNVEDVFGTEGQNDPRGDFREDRFTLNYHLQGIDDE